MKRLVLLAALVAVSGCANRMLVDLHNGTLCSSTNVEAYAKMHKLTYKQALDELRRQSDKMWDEEEAKLKADGKMKSKPAENRADTTTEKTAKAANLSF